MSSKLTCKTSLPAVTAAACTSAACHLSDAEERLVVRNSSSWRSALRHFLTDILSGSSMTSPTSSLHLHGAAASGAGTTGGSVVTMMPQAVQHGVLRASLLLSLENGERQRDATKLYWDTEAHRGNGEWASGACSFVRPLKSSNEGEQRDRDVPRQARLLGGRGAGGTGIFLCESSCRREIRKRLQEGQWHQALKILDETSITQDATAAVAVEVYAAADDWQRALELLQCMNDPSRSTRETAAVLSAMYRAAKRSSSWHHRPFVSGSPIRSPPIPLGAGAMWEIALTTYALPCGSVTGSSAALNNLLGVLGSQERWMEATRVLNATLNEQQQHLRQVGSGFSDDEANRSATTATLKSEAAFVQHTAALPPRLNAVTVSQACYALRTSWFLALNVCSKILAGELVKRQELDLLAVSRLLKVCLSNDRWREALYLLDVCHRNQLQLEVELSLRMLATFARHTESRPLCPAVLDQQIAHPHPQFVGNALNQLIWASKSLSEALVWQRQAIERGYAIEPRCHGKLLEHHAQAGDWQESLRLLTQLWVQHRQQQTPNQHPRPLHQQEQASNSAPNEAAASSSLAALPWSRFHDSVQYSIVTSAASHTPSWALSMRLFCEMEQHQHISGGKNGQSEIAFQCAVKRCFAQNALDQAQQLFAFMVRRGVGGGPS